MPAPPTRWIRTADDLDDLVHELAGVRAIGLDTEADSLHHYAEQVCLIQLSTFGGDACLIDPLALDDLSPLAPILADPTVVKVLHGGDNDVTSLRRDFGFRFRTVFDTALAARLLGDAEVGLQALVRAELGVSLSKGSQRDDWSKRPLTATQEAYALADVAHLMALATRLTHRLAAAGRTEWAREEFAALAELTPTPSTRAEPDGYRRIKGAAALSRRHQAVLRELHVWREARAAAADRPPFKIVGPDVLVALAARAPTDVADVARVLARYPRQADQVEVVAAAIARGLALPERELPSPARGERAPMSAAARRRVTALRAWRDQQAEASRLDPALVMPQRVIERVASAGPRTLDELAVVDGVRRWRVDAWGPALLAAAGRP
ncbi:MAG: HRDC domain-containing protein [Kofleriaceae bacterium]